MINRFQTRRKMKDDGAGAPCTAASRWDDADTAGARTFLSERRISTVRNGGNKSVVVATTACRLETGEKSKKKSISALQRIKLVPGGKRTS